MKQLSATGTELDDLALAALYAGDGERDFFVRLNMVATVDGSAHGPDGLSGTINTGADHRVFSLLRAWADVVLAGSGTVTAEGYRSPTTDPRWAFLRAGRPAHPALGVLTSAADLPPGVDDGLGGETFVLRSSRSAGMTSALAQLRARGYRCVLCEGGPTIAGELLAAGLVDELCLTVAPRVVVGDAGRIAHGPSVLTDWTLAGLLEEDGTLITRWRPNPPK